MRSLIDGRLLLILAVWASVAACLTADLGSGPRHGWWDGLGPVLPHDSFPADCKLCHVGSGWHSLTDDFAFDHLAETGVPLLGAHDGARCLRCHNDRGPVEVFEAQSCAGCHEDIHLGQLGPDCLRCHQQDTWRPVGQITLHNRTRFPLVGIHAVTACFQCHPGADVGNFVPTPVQCLACHKDDLQQANNPNHIALGWVDDCDRCHIPTTWSAAQIDG